MSSNAPTPAVDIETLLAHRDWLRALAMSLVGDESRADDVVQDTWLAALRRPPRDAGASKSWLRAVAKNVVRDRHRVGSRRHGREAAVARSEAAPDTTDVVARAELQRALTRHVLALEEPYRTTILLRFFDGLQPRAVAVRMGVPAETVRTRVRRGIAQLREALGGEHGRGDAWRVALVPLIRPLPGPTAGAAGGSARALAKTAAVFGAAAPLSPAAWLAACAVLAALAVALVLTSEPPAPAETAAAPPAVAPPPAAGEEPPQPDTPPATTAQADEPAPPDKPAATGRGPATAAPRSYPALPGTELTGGLVRFPATDAQPIGMDEAEIKVFLVSDLGRDLERWEKFPFLWSFGFLFFTPAHTQAVPEFEIAPFETTNSQWKVFLDDSRNADVGLTQPGMTLRSLVRAIYEVEADEAPVQAQRLGLELYYRNEGRLMAALNPGADPAWEPLRAWVDDTVLPSGVKIDFTLIPPPAYWPRGQIPDEELDRPVRAVSRSDAQAFCRWAGMHLPLEIEWERAARGDEGRRFPWGDEWNPRAAVWRLSRGADLVNDGPEVVDSLPEGATPEGVHHLLGNVSEFVFDFARRYAGSRSEFKYDNSGLLLKGGMWDDSDYVMLAADRIWDAGTSIVTPDVRADGFGFRYARYPQPGRDLALELATYADEHYRVKGAPTWLPYPVGLSAKDREVRTRRQPLQGFAIERTAGWMSRHFDSEAEHHANVTGPARGIALLPIRGILGSYLKDQGRLEALSRDEDEVALVGALLATDQCKIHLVDEDGARVTLDTGDRSSALWTRHDVGFSYQVGAWLVLRGERIAVYPGDGSDVGVFGAHLRNEPLGYLPDDYVATWGIASETPPNGSYDGGVATLTVRVPQLEKDGSVKKNAKCVRLTVRVPATFE